MLLLALRLARVTIGSSRELRLTGLVAEDSIPSALVGLMVLLVVVVAVRVCSLLLSRTKTTKEVHMVHLTVWLYSMAETFWAVGTSYAAGALPASAQDQPKTVDTSIARSEVANA